MFYKFHFQFNAGFITEAVKKIYSKCFGKDQPSDPEAGVGQYGATEEQEKPPAVQVSSQPHLLNHRTGLNHTLSEYNC